MANGSWVCRDRFVWGLGLLVLCLGCDATANQQALEEAKKANEAAQRAQAEAEQAKRELEALKAKQAAPAVTQEPAPEAAAREAAATAPPSASTAAPPPVASMPSGAAPGSKPGEYSLEAIRAIASDCKEPSVMLSAVSNNVAKKDDFVWAFAVQAFYAHPQFVLGNKVSLDRKGRVALHQVQVNPSAVGLVAYCKDGATCNEVAAMYKATVPSSKPEVYCGKKWERGIVPRGLLNAVDLKALAFQKLKQEPVSMCARIGICTIQQDPATPGDPGVNCQRAPTKHKYKCGQEKTCEAVVACARG